MINKRFLRVNGLDFFPLQPSIDDTWERKWHASAGIAYIEIERRARGWVVTAEWRTWLNKDMAVTAHDKRLRVALAALWQTGEDFALEMIEQGWGIRGNGDWYYPREDIGEIPF